MQIWVRIWGPFYLLPSSLSLLYVRMNKLHRIQIHYHFVINRSALWCNVSNTRPRENTFLLEISKSYSTFFLYCYKIWNISKGQSALSRTCGLWQRPAETEPASLGLWCWPRERASSGLATGRAPPGPWGGGRRQALGTPSPTDTAESPEDGGRKGHSERKPGVIYLAPYWGSFMLVWMEANRNKWM